MFALILLYLILLKLKPPRILRWVLRSERLHVPHQLRRGDVGFRLHTRQETVSRTVVVVDIICDIPRSFFPLITFLRRLLGTGVPVCKRCAQLLRHLLRHLLLDTVCGFGGQQRPPAWLLV